MAQDNESSQDNLQSLEDQLKSEKSRRTEAEQEVARQKQVSCLLVDTNIHTYT